MERKNKYSRDERLRQGSQSTTPRPIPRPVKPYNSYSSYFQVQHVAPGFGVNPGKRFVMISGENIRADFAGKVKLPDGSTVRFESVDHLEIDEKIRFIVIRLDPKKKTLEALAVEALLSGKASLWIDALAFFSATRKYGEYTIDNIGSVALSMNAYATARLKMLTYKGHSGRALKVRPNLLIVGPTNEGTAHDIIKAASKLTARVEGAGENAQTIFGTISNSWMGTAEVLIDPDLDAQWFLADVTKPLKPVVIQKRKEPKLTRLDNEMDENVFNRKEYIYGTDARGAAFLGFPHLIHGSFPE